MRPRTAVRSDRFSAGVARLLILSGVLLAVLGLAALVFRTSFPLFGWVAWAPDMLALTVLAAARTVPPRPLFRPFGS